MHQCDTQLTENCDVSQRVLGFLKGNYCINHKVTSLAGSLGHNDILSQARVNRDSLSMWVYPAES